MAKIKLVYTCPRCEEGITAVSKPEICPGCGAKFPATGSGGFMTPITITEQEARISDDIARTKFVLSLPLDTANNILNDALTIMQTLPGKKVKKSDIRIIMGIANRIGEIAKAYEQFLIAGGAHTPELFIKENGEHTNESTKTRAGEDSAAPKPTPLFTSLE